MGSAASSCSNRNRGRYLHVRHGNRIAKVRIESLCCRKEIQEAIALGVGLDRKSDFVLRDSNGTVTVCSAATAPNGIKDPYEITEVRPPATEESVVEAASVIAGQLQRILDFDQFQNDVKKKLSQLEKRIDRETMKLNDIAKVQATLRQLQDTIAENKSIDFSRLRPSAQSSDTFYVPMIENHSSFHKPKREKCWEFTKYQLSEETISYLKTPTFDIWQWDHNEMVVLLEYMYQELGIVEELSISPQILRRWLLAVQENYRNNPFHNFRHCFCVTQMMYGLIHVCHLNDVFSRQDLAVLITAAICHDVDHPGFNNTYQINAKTELAIRYNDVSPLENHHCAVAFKILGNPDWNIFGNVEAEVFRQIRAGIIELILATDMARHGVILETFRTVVDQFSFENEQHVNSLKQVLIKACDISNEVRPMDVSGPWVECLLEEYFAQAERERSEGLPVAPFMDPTKVTKATAQLGFIQFVLSPLFESLAKLFPQLEEMMVIPLRKAQEYYTNLKERERPKDQQ